jgi:hypothetical protein
MVCIAFSLALHSGYVFYSINKARTTRTGNPIPYTLRLRETFHAPNGVATVTSDVVSAVRSDGSIVQWIEHRIGQQSSERTIQFASGQEIAVNERAKIKSTTRNIGAHSARWQRDPASRCVNSFAGEPMISLNEVVQGEDVIDDYRAVRVIADNVTRWYALDYGCAPIRDIADWGPGKGYSEHQLVSLTPGEPDPALFHVQSDMREAPPSLRLMTTPADRARCDSKCRHLLDKFDAQYRARQ